MQITNVVKAHSQADNSDFLDVEFHFADGDKTLTRKLAFPLTATAKEIQAELKKYEATFASDKALAEASKQVEEANKQADKTIKQLMK